MKNLLIAAVLMATASAASAKSINELPQTVEYEVRILVPDANLDNLTSAQVLAIESIMMSSEERSAGSDPAGSIKVILGMF